MCATDKGSFFSARLWSHVCLSRRIYVGQPHSYRRQNNWELTWECNFQPTIIWGSIAQYQCLRTLQAMMTREETKWETLEGSLRNWEKLRSGRSPLNTRTFHLLFRARRFIPKENSWFYSLALVMVRAGRSPHDLRLDRSLLMTVPCSPGTSSSSTSCS